MKKLILALFLFAFSGTYAQSNKYVFVFLNKKTDKEELLEDQVKKLMEGHLANINRLAKEGKLIAAGPFDEGGGIFIFNTPSTDLVKEWLKPDPGIQANRWNIEILPYYPRMGEVCSVKEPYEMVTYNFVRFVPNIMKYNITDLPTIFKKHYDYMKLLSNTGNVIAESIFGDSDGGILVMKGELQKEVIENDPAVKEGLLEADIKTLWIAKGSFCEK
jgi:uncharacterized protein YciI